MTILILLLSFDIFDLETCSLEAKDTEKKFYDLNIIVFLRFQKVPIKFV